MADKSECYAAILIKKCRENAKLKAEVLAGIHGDFDKTLVECERAWTEEELYGSKKL